jgi:hypothetical protein
MRKTPLSLMFLGHIAPSTQENTMRKTLLALAWFAGSAVLTFVIVYLCTIAPFANSTTPAATQGHQSTPAPSY